MKDISDFLNRVLVRIDKHKAIENTFIFIIKDLFNIDLKYKDINIQNQTLFIKSNPILKNEILIRKKEILEELEKKHPKSKIIDIK